MDESAMPESSAERWLPVVGFEGSYEVSDLGRVRSLDRVVGKKFMAGQLLRPNARNKKYPYFKINLGSGDGHRYASVHVLVAEAFLGPRPEKHDVCHGPGGRLDNRLTNLYYGTHARNTGPDKDRDGTSNAGIRNGNARLTDEIVSECRSRATAGESCDALAAEFGVNVATMRQAVTGKTWRHVPSPARFQGRWPGRSVAA